MVDFQSFMQQQNSPPAAFAPQPVHSPPPPPPPQPAPLAGPAGNRYAGIEEAEMIGQRNRRVCDYLGMFAGEIVEIRDGTTQVGGQQVFACTLRVTDSDNSHLPPGSLVDWAVTGPHPQWGLKYFFSNIKGFASAVFGGVTSESITAEVIEKMRNQNQPCRGHRVGWQVYQKTQQNGKSVNRTQFHAAQKQPE